MRKLIVGAEDLPPEARAAPGGKGADVVFDLLGGIMFRNAGNSLAPSELVTGLIRHLHAFVKEAKLTDGEFKAGWTLIAEMAKFTGNERNEFLLFCDVAGISELIDAINHARSQSAVGYALVGPLYGDFDVKNKRETKLLFLLGFLV